MAAQKQGQQLDDAPRRGRERKRSSWTRWIIVGIVLVLIAVGSTIWLLSGQSPWTTVLPVVIFTVLGVMIGLFQWLFPVSSGTHEHPAPPFPASLMSQVSAAGTPMTSMSPIFGYVP